MCEQLIRRGVLVAWALASSSVIAFAQVVDLPLKPSVLDEPSVISAINQIPTPLTVQDEPVVVRRKKSVVDAYAPVGINTGGLRFFPTLELGAVISSNPAQSNATPKADTALRLRPGLRFESDWSRHRWSGSANIDFLHYLNDPNLSSMTGQAATDFRLDIRRRTHADFAASFVANQTGLGDNSLPATAAEPRRDKSYGVSADLVHDFGGLEASVKLALLRNSFDNVALVGGGTENNADRNFIEPSVTLRATYGQQGTPIKPYAEISYAPRIHDQKIDRNGNQRDSQGFSAALGVGLDDGPIWQDDLALTYLVRNYVDATLATESAIGLRGRIKWRPTGLLQLDAISGVDLGETASAGIGGTRSWNVGLTAIYAIRDNINLLAGVGYSTTNTGTAITDNRTVSAGIDWTLNPNMTASIGYQGTWFNDGTGLGSGNYNDQRLLTSIVLKK